MVFDAVDGDFEVALLDQEHLFPGMTMDGVRLLPGVEGGDVDFEFVEGTGRVVEDLAHLADGSGFRNERVPVDEGAGKDGRVFGRGVGSDNDGLLGGCGRGGEKEDQERGFHAGNYSRTRAVLSGNASGRPIEALFVDEDIPSLHE